MRQNKPYHVVSPIIPHNDTTSDIEIINQSDVTVLDHKNNPLVPTKKEVLVKLTTSTVYHTAKIFCLSIDIGLKAGYLILTAIDNQLTKMVADAKRKNAEKQEAKWNEQVAQSSHNTVHFEYSRSNNKVNIKLKDRY